MANISKYDNYDYAAEGIFRPSKANREKVSKMELKEMLSIYIKKKQRSDAGFFDKSGSKLKAAIKEMDERYGTDADNEGETIQTFSIEGIPFGVVLKDNNPRTIMFMRAGSVAGGKLAKISVNSLKSIARSAARELDRDDRAAKKAAKNAPPAESEAPAGESLTDFDFDEEDVEAMEGVVKWLKEKRRNHKAKKAAKNATVEDEGEGESIDADSECVESLENILLESYLDGDIDFF